MGKMYPGAHVEEHGDKPAVIMANSGEVVTYRQLDERSMQVAQMLHAAGLRPRDHIAIMLDNDPRYFEIYWGAQRAGLYITPINWHLTADEGGYIIEDCGASALFMAASLAPVAAQMGSRLDGLSLRVAVGGDVGNEVQGFVDYDERLARFPAEPLADEIEGSFMFYSSGTTGRPKGILGQVQEVPFGEGVGALVTLIQMMYGITSDTIYLCPAPLYHAAPLGWSTAVQRLGGTVVVIEKFDPLGCLATIERQRISHAQFVPTHFIRMLKLPEADRQRFDHSSLQMVVHAAAPCPIDVKRQMIEWWGPIINEFYAGSEGNGFYALNSAEALARPGSVGRALLGIAHICDEYGNEMPTGEAGQIWFESPTDFSYHNDPIKTASAHNAKGWSSLGDIGYLDGDGYLYLTDRTSHMIISGGVNIYPQEVENELSMHPKVADVAVIGVPNADLGEEVKAVVIVAVDVIGDDALAAELITFCRSRLAHFKCPVSIDFVDELPRLPTGKLLKRQLRSSYWPA